MGYTGKWRHSRSRPTDRQAFGTLQFESLVQGAAANSFRSLS